MSHESKIDENVLQTNLKCTKKLQEINVSLLVKDFIHENDSTKKKIRDTVYVLCYRYTCAELKFS